MEEWRSETQTRLVQNLLYTTLHEKCLKDSGGTHVLALVDEAIYFAYNKTKTIIKHMGEYTLHDGEHLFRVLDLMERLLTKPNIEKLTIPELMLLILCAFFHDIGMAPEEKEILTWKKMWDSVTPSFVSEQDSESFNNFARFCSTKPDQIRKIYDFMSQGKYTEADTVKAHLISEYIRTTHAERAREIIGEHWDGKILYKDTDLTVEFAQLCFSHNEEALLLLNMDKSYLCGPGVIACLPLVGIILRLADILDFDAKRTPAILFSHLYVRNPISVSEWNKHRSVQSWDISAEIIQFHAKCKHPVIEATIREFCDSIDIELSIGNNIINSINAYNKVKNRDLEIKIPYSVNREKIETKKNIRGVPEYIYKETKFTLSKRQVIDLLMGTKLYGNPEVALRELLQNSIDACLLRQSQEKSWNNNYIPEITINIKRNGQDSILEVIDNGTGMDEDIIDKYYSKVGSSFYKSTDFYKLKSESNADFAPTSRFGIGVLSCFMVAESFEVETRKVYGPHSSSEPINILVEGQESIFWIKAGTRSTPGTSTKLYLKKDNPWSGIDDQSFINSIEAVIPNPPFKITINTPSQTVVMDEMSFKQKTVSSIQDYSWKLNTNSANNVKTFEIPLDNKGFGIFGSAIVALLMRDGCPTLDVNIEEVTVNIKGVDYPIRKRMFVEENRILQESTLISIDDNKNIVSQSSSIVIAQSISKLSLHGIEVTAKLFPQSWEVTQNQVRLSWPISVLILVDVSGNNDLDLNSARTQIIMSEKWLKFEEELAYLIGQGISKELGVDWENFKSLIFSRNLSPQFRRGFERV